MATPVPSDKQEPLAIENVDEPSAQWGWHGTFPKARRIIGWLAVIATFSLLIGNHAGRIEDLWVIGVGAGMAGLLIWDHIRSRTPWRQ